MRSSQRLRGLIQPRRDEKGKKALTDLLKHVISRFFHHHVEVPASAEGTNRGLYPITFATDHPHGDGPLGAVGIGHWDAISYEWFSEGVAIDKRTTQGRALDKTVPMWD